MQRPTEQQQAAVQRRDVSVVLASGAGCGKTFVLSERYLAHLREDGLQVGQIVAITFTERAAREMRDRIRTKVSDGIRAARTDAAAEGWQHHLRSLESATISTIHSFCANLLRQNAVVAGIDPHFEVLEDALSRSLETEVLQESLENLLLSESPEGEEPATTNTQLCLEASGRCR